MKYLNIRIAFIAVALAFTSQASAQFTPAQEQTIEKTYLLNGGFEGGKGKWTAYKDAAASSPVDGVSGTATVMSVAASTSSPIAGKSSGVISHTAANGQGEGISIPFTLDQAAKGRPLSIQGVYTVNSGTYSGGTSSTNSDVVLYIYDVDTSTLIQPSGYKLDGGVSGITYTINATFQSHVTSTNYRLIAHSANTTATAFSLKLDQIKIGLQNRPMGPPITDWATVTVTGSWVSGATYVAKSRRVGDSEEYLVEITGTSTVTAASLTLTIPRTIDTTKLATTSGSSNLGEASILDAGTTDYTLGKVSYASTSAVAILYGYSAAAGLGDLGTSVTNAAPFTFNTGDKVYAKFRVPIVGWSSNTIVSSDSASRTVAMRALTNTSGTSYNNGPTQVALATVVFDTHGKLASNVYTIPVAGYYHINGATSLAGTLTGTQDITVLGRINGSTTYRLGVTTGNGANANYTVSGSGVTLLLNAGDTVDMLIQTGAAGAMPVSTTAAYTWFEIKQVQGPSQIQAATEISLRYTSATTSAFNGAPIKSFATKVFDNTTAWSGSRFTAPAPGRYRVHGHLQTIASAWTVGNNARAFFLKNGSSSGQPFAFEYSNPATGTYQVSSAFSATFDLITGDYLEMSTDASIATTFSANADRNYIQIERIGGIN